MQGCISKVGIWKEGPSVSLCGVYVFSLCKRKFCAGASVLQKCLTDSLRSECITNELNTKMK